MAADLHIHVFADDDLTEEDLKCFFHNTLGSKWGPSSFASIFDEEPCENKFKCEHGKRIHKTKYIWIGEVSWLKAALLEDGKTFIPETVGEVSDIIGEELPIITDDLIERVKKAFDLPNITGYSLAKVEDVLKFLTKHKGKKAFTISW